VGRQGVVFARTDTGENEVPAESVQNDLEYVVPVTIGTPGVQLLLDFDTGSSDLWVWSSKLKATKKTLTGHTIYDPSKSSTSQNVAGSSWNISYGDGSSASGGVYTDVVKLGSLSIPNQGVELASKLSSSFLSGEGSDGLLGLAFPSINTATPQQKTPMQNLIEQGIVSQGVFSCLLQNQTTGFYSFGTIPAQDAGVSLPSIAYTPIDNSQGFWMFDSTSAVVNGQTISLSGNTAIADTGTTLALVSDEVVSAIYGAIPGAKLDNNQGGYVYPQGAAVPTVQFAVGNQLYTVNPENFGYGEASGGFIFGGIQSRGKNPFDILGDVFLKNVFVVFDQGNTQIGMAQRGPATSS
jgi:hypothetical protein